MVWRNQASGKVPERMTMIDNSTSEIIENMYLSLVEKERRIETEGCEERES